MKLTVRPWEQGDIGSIVDYFLNAELEFIRGMGADKHKLPKKEDWIQKLKLEFNKTNLKREYYYIIWFLDNKPVGHSNINNIKFGKSATMHLHLWDQNLRKKGLGIQLLRQTIPIYFKEFDLKIMYCEPYAENIPPNKTLKKLGFEFVRCYHTTPGTINFPQWVNRYQLKVEQLVSI
jgi:RimJ/RimL family protein N-acetyltransferase